MQVIPLIDICESGPLALLEQHREKALSLIRASRNAFGRMGELASYAALPLGDFLVKKWLERAQNPYRHEIADFNRMLATSGVFALNLAYEFGCTSGVYATAEGPRLLRVLDWPFAGLGANMVVARQQGTAGDYYNVTWPAVSGIYTAMAKGRFSAAINQAPMRRHKGGMYTDWIRNRIWVWREKSLPPAHLLRKVFETARNYEEAKEMLMREPIALPVIYILAGTKPGEGCVIERLEEGAALREMGSHPHIQATNHFLSHINGIGHGWLPRAIDSCGRAVCAGIITSGQAADPEMSWYKPPIANVLSRLCFSGNATDGAMSLLGTEGERPVTELFRF